MTEKTCQLVKMGSKFLYECPVCKGHLKYLVEDEIRFDVDCICEQCGREYTMFDLYRGRAKE